MRVLSNVVRRLSSAPAVPSRASRVAVLAALLVLALGACTQAPVRPPVVEAPAYDPVVIVSSIRASGAATATELDVQPLRNAEVEDLRQQAAVHERGGRAGDAAAALDQALAIVPDDAAVLQERSEVALLLRDLDGAERFAREAAARGTQVGPLCRRHQETLAQLADLRARRLPDDPAHARAAVDARAKRDACTIAAPARY